MSETNDPKNPIANDNALPDDQLEGLSGAGYGLGGKSAQVAGAEDAQAGPAGSASLSGYGIGGSK